MKPIQIEQHAPKASYLSLLATRRFAPLFYCQFFAAVGDNFLLNALTFLILFRFGGLGDAALIPFATATLIVPSFFLSALGGEIADRFDMALVARWLRIAGLAVAVVATFGFFLQLPLLLFVALLLAGVIGALFVPVKFGVLPRLLTRTELGTGNALVEGSTVIAILLGTIIAGLAVRYGNAGLMAGVMIGLSLMTWVASILIPPTDEAAPDLVIRQNVLASTLEVLKDLGADRRVAWAAWVTSWFWGAGAVVLAILPVLVKGALGGTELAVTVCLAIFSIGVAVGSGLAAWLCGARMTLLPIVIGAALMGLFAIDLGWTTFGLESPPDARPIGVIFGSAQGVHIAIALAGLAVAGGLFIVPAMTAIQLWTGADRRARAISAMNILNAAAMTGAALVAAILLSLEVKPQTMFILLGASSLLVTVVICRNLPSRN